MEHNGNTYRGPAVPKTTIKYLERRTDCDGVTLHFMTSCGPNPCPTQIIDREDIPDPENGAGWFEVEQVARGPWLKWRAIRRVEPTR